MSFASALPKPKKTGRNNPANNVVNTGSFAISSGGGLGGALGGGLGGALGGGALGGGFGGGLGGGFGGGLGSSLGGGGLGSSLGSSSSSSSQALALAGGAAGGAPPYGFRARNAKTNKLQSKWIPRQVADFADGGAFPEISVS
jgi:hypothetical protein